MSLLIKLLARWGVPERFRRIAAFAALVLAALALLALVKTCVERAAVDRHEAKVAAQVAKSAQRATETADRNDAARQVEDAKAAILIERAIADAKARNPDQAGAAAGPVTRAALDELRRREAKDRPAAR
jgi:hypothetical protein